MFKSNQIGYGVYHGYLMCETKRIFAIACLEKKIAIHTEIFDYFQYLIFKYSIFCRAKVLFKSNQTGYGFYHGYLVCKQNFALACLGKNLGFHTKICD